MSFRMPRTGAMLLVAAIVTLGTEATLPQAEAQRGGGRGGGARAGGAARAGGGTRTNVNHSANANVNRNVNANVNRNVNVDVDHHYHRGGYGYGGPRSREQSAPPRRWRSRRLPSEASCTPCHRLARRWSRPA